jgi:hypothetical protein
MVQKPAEGRPAVKARRAAKPALQAKARVGSRAMGIPMETRAKPDRPAKARPAQPARANAKARPA